MAATVPGALFDTAAALALIRACGADQGLPLIAGAIRQAIPDTPDRICVLTLTSGGPLRAEGAIDTPTVQLRYRGRQADPTDAEHLALLGDAALLAAAPLTVNGVRIYAIDRSGGRPTALLPNPSPGLRSEYTCTYVLQVSR